MIADWKQKRSEFDATAHEAVLKPGLREMIGPLQRGLSEFDWRSFLLVSSCYSSCYSGLAAYVTGPPSAQLLSHSWLRNSYHFQIEAVASCLITPPLSLFPLTSDS